MDWSENTGGLGGSMYDRRSPGLRYCPSPHWSEVNTVRNAFRRYPWLIYVVLALLAFYVFESILSRSDAPVKVLSAEPMQRTVPAGGELQIKLIVDRNEICENSIMSYWTDTNGREIMRLPLRSRTIPKVGRNLPVFVTVPVPNVPGQACYQSTVMHRCDGGSVPVSTPPVCVLITPQEVAP